MNRFEPVQNVRVSIDHSYQQKDLLVSVLDLLLVGLGEQTRQSTPAKNATPPIQRRIMPVFTEPIIAMRIRPIMNAMMLQHTSRIPKWRHVSLTFRTLSVAASNTVSGVMMMMNSALTLTTVVLVMRSMSAMMMTMTMPSTSHCLSASKHSGKSNTFLLIFPTVTSPYELSMEKAESLLRHIWAIIEYLTCRLFYAYCYSSVIMLHFGLLMHVILHGRRRFQ